MTKGATATLRFSFPFSTTLLKDVLIVVKDYKSPTMYTIRKKLSDCVVNEKSVMATLTPQETINFKEHNKLKIQLTAYFNDGSKHLSDVFYKTVKEILDEEVVE